MWARWECCLVVCSICFAEEAVGGHPKREREEQHSPNTQPTNIYGT